jgi:hypothetical protein
MYRKCLKTALLANETKGFAEICQLPASTMRRKWPLDPFNAEVTSVQIDKEELVGVTVKDRNGDCEIACRNLVIAAGSCSERVVDTLFPKSFLHLEFDKSPRSARNWMVLKAPRPSSSDYCHQVCVESITGTPVEISDYRDGRIYVGGYLAHFEALPATPIDVRHQYASIAQMLEVARQFVDFDISCQRCWKRAAAIVRY